MRGNRGKITVNKPCKKCKMPTSSKNGYCESCGKSKSFAYDQRRGSSSSRGYDRRWEKARLIFIAANPLCGRCAAAGRVERTTVVDHIIPHKGDQELFWDKSNWQGLCETCHNRKTINENRMSISRITKKGIGV